MLGTTMLILYHTTPMETYNVKPGNPTPYSDWLTKHCKEGGSFRIHINSHTKL